MLVTYNPVMLYIRNCFNIYKCFSAYTVCSAKSKPLWLSSAYRFIIDFPKSFQIPPTEINGSSKMQTDVTPETSHKIRGHTREA